MGGGRQLFSSFTKPPSASLVRICHHEINKAEEQLARTVRRRTDIWTGSISYTSSSCCCHGANQQQLTTSHHFSLPSFFRLHVVLLDRPHTCTFNMTSTTESSSFQQIAGPAATAVVQEHDRHCEQNQQDLIGKRQGFYTNKDTHKFPSNDESGSSATEHEAPFFGVSINGYHPQWSASSNILLTSPPRKRIADQHRAQMMPYPSDVVSTKINELICRLRRDEEEKKKKRRMDFAAKAEERNRKRSASALTPTMALTTRSEDSPSSSSTMKQNRNDYSSLYGDIFLKSSVAQLIVSPGGRILACEFHIFACLFTHLFTFPFHL